MTELNTTLHPQSQTFIDILDSVRAGVNNGQLKNDQDVINYITELGYDPEHYAEANREYKRLEEKGINPREVGLGELAFKTATKFISDTAEALSNKVPITKNLGNLIGDDTKDWWSKYSDPYTPPGAKEITKEIGADLGQGAAGILTVGNIVPRVRKFIKGDKVDVNKIKKFKEAANKVSKLKTYLKKGAYNSSIAAGGLTLTFNPDEATLDILKKSFPKTVEWSGMEPVFDALAVNPEDPKALQYTMQFAQELIAAGVVMTPFALTGLLIRAARNSRKIKAKEDGIDSSIETTKNKGDDTIANQADQEKVIVNQVIDDPDAGYLKNIVVSKPISRFGNIKEEFTSTRNIGNDAYDLWITKLGTPKIIREKTASRIRDFNKSIKKEYGASKFSKLSKDLQDKINNILLLDKDNPAYQKIFNRNIDALRPVIKKQLDEENIKRVAEGKKKIPLKNYNAKLKDLTKAEASKLTDKFFRLQQQKLLRSFKPETREILKKIRQDVDDHSRYLKNSGYLNTDLSRIFSANDRFYMQRSYEIFDNPAISRNLNKAWSLLLQGKENISKFNKWKYATEINKLEKYHRYLQSITGLQKEKIPSIIKDLISKEGAENAASFLDRYSKNYGNPNILKHRKIFSKELRDLWGERTNPLTRYALTMDTIGKISAQLKFLEDLKIDGLNKGYLYASKPYSKPKKSKKENIDQDLDQIKYELQATDRVHLGNVKREGGLQLPENMKSPLEGIFADADFAAGLRRGLSNDELTEGGGWLKMWRAATSGIKMGAEVFKTVLSPITHTVNFNGNWNFAFLLGGMSPIQLVKNLSKTMTPKFLKGKEWNDWFEKRLKLGMIDQSVNANQMRAYMRDLSDVASGTKFDPSTRTKKIINNILLPLRIPTKIYQGADSVMRATVFDSLRSSVRRGIEPTLKNMPIANKRTLDDVLDHFIAERVRMRMPTWSMVPKGIRRLKDVPLISAFPSWFVEVLRTAKNSLGGIARDLSGKSVDDLARHAGFKNADDMLQKTGYDLRTNKKVMRYLRGKGMWGLGAGTGLAVGYDALTDTSRATYNISQEKSDALSYLVDYYQATPKIFTNYPEKVIKDDPRSAFKSEHLIYSYREPSRVDVWQQLKNPVRRMIRTLKEDSTGELTDRQFNRELSRTIYEIVAPVIGPSIAAQGLYALATNNVDLFAEGSRTREIAEFFEEVLGPNKAFSPGFITELQKFSESNMTEYNLKNFGVKENVWEWDGKTWINKGVREPEAVRAGIGVPQASKYEAGSLWNAISRGEFDKITKENFLANLGLKTKQVDINKLLQFKISPLLYKKDTIRKDFIQDLIKYKTLGITEDRLLNLWSDTLEKHYQADRQISNLMSKFKILGLSDDNIAITLNKVQGSPLKIKTEDVVKMLEGRYDNNQLWLTNHPRILNLLKELGINIYRKKGPTPIIDKMNTIQNTYTNKLFKEE